MGETQMGKVIILPETTKDPISLIGRRAGICWGADVEDPKKNYKRGLGCIKSNHGRTLEFPCVDMILDGYSAKVIREYYTHIGCLPARLQASTRYINYSNFGYITPHTIQNNERAKKIFDELMDKVADTYQELLDLGIPVEDAGMTLPISMETKMVEHRNLRNLMDMSRNRMCTRANWEFRELFNDICKALSEYSDEWKEIIPMLMMPKCEYLGFCPEEKSCGRKPKKPE